MFKKDGFSLIEVLMASVVFSLTMLGLFSVFVSSSKQLVHLRERTTSAQLGKFFLDPLQSYVRYDTWATNDLGLTGTNKTGAGSPQTINNRVFSEKHDVNIVGTELRRVISRISWTEPSA